MFDFSRAARPASRDVLATVLCAVLLVFSPATLAATTAAAPQAGDPGGVVAFVDGRPVTEGDLAAADSALGRNVPMVDTAERREIILQILAETMLLGDLARRQNLDEDADTKRRIAFARDQGLATQLMADVARRSTSEEKLRAAYKELVLDVMRPEPEYHVHELVFVVPPPGAVGSDDPVTARAEAATKAEAAWRRLDQGEAFATVVRAFSVSPDQDGSTGDMGWQTGDTLGKEYVDVLAGLKPGQLSRPFATEAGWHIIKLEAVRERKVPGFEDSREGLAGMLATRAQYELVDGLRDKIKRVAPLAVPQAAPSP